LYSRLRSIPVSAHRFKVYNPRRAKLIQVNWNTRTGRTILKIIAHCASWFPAPRFRKAKETSFLTSLLKGERLGKLAAVRCLGAKPLPDEHAARRCGMDDLPPVAHVLRSPLRFSGVTGLTGINASLASCNIKGFFQQRRLSAQSDESASTMSSSSASAISDSGSGTATGAMIDAWAILADYRTLSAPGN
jgi:hypothetical protein